ncbi:hypothetical protein FAIPA1_30328 [Frankia sp. AiPs1]
MAGAAACTGGRTNRHYRADEEATRRLGFGGSVSGGRSCRMSTSRAKKAHETNTDPPGCAERLPEVPPGVDQRHAGLRPMTALLTQALQVTRRAIARVRRRTVSHRRRHLLPYPPRVYLLSDSSRNDMAAAGFSVTNSPSADVRTTTPVLSEARCVSFRGAQPYHHP